jgi:hypothetical protein
MPPDYEERIIDGEVYRRNPGEDWKLIPSSEAVHKANTEPISPPKVENAVKVQRAIRDLKTNAYFPPLAVIDAVRSIANGGVPQEPTGGINIGTGNLRNVLTNYGGKVGGTAGGFLGLPSGPGAIATSIAGYLAGSGIGSGIGQEFEAAAPNLSQSGYGSKDGPDATVPSFGNAVEDTATNAAFDVGLGTAAKIAPFITPQSVGKYFTNSPTGKAKWEQSIKDLMLSKYNPLNRGGAPKINPIESPIDSETIDAVNNLPHMPMSVGTVLGENNPFSRLQRFLTGEGEQTLQNQQNREIGEAARQFKFDVDIPPAHGAQSEARQIGREGAMKAQALKEFTSSVEGKAYQGITKFALPTKVRVGGQIDPTTPMNRFRIANGLPPLPPAGSVEKEVLGPIKLSGLNAAYDVYGKKLDSMIGQITDPALASELKIVRDRLNIGESLDLKDWDAVRVMESQLGTLANNKNLPPALKSELRDISKTLETDIRNNLQGKVKETSKFWKPGADAQYMKAKGLTVREHDLYPKEITKAIEKSVGEVPAYPEVRGGDLSKYYDKVMDSPADAERLIEVSGRKTAKSAFVSKLFNKFQNPETKVIHGEGMLKELSSDNTGAISNIVLDATDRQKLRQLGKVSARVNPKLNAMDQMAVQQGADDWSFNLPGEALSAALGGSKTGLLKGIGRFASVHIGGDKLANAFLNNNAFARDLMNSIGKPVSRPGMGQEIGRLIKNLQGVKLIIRSDGKEYEYDTDTKQMTEKK